uniref:oligopeptidase A n=1 Tax=Erythrolobus australicus TaxID=1077150 RepID=A0A7S1TKL9_9RHOD
MAAAGGSAGLSMSDKLDRSNPLLATGGDSLALPRFDAIRPEHVQPAIGALLKSLEARLSELEANLEARAASGAPAVWDELVLPLEALGDELGRAWGAVNHLKAVKDTAELRAAVEEVQPTVVAFSSRVAQSKAVYAAFKALQSDGASYGALSRAQRRIVDANVRDAELGGVALGEAERERFNAIKQELAQLSTKFSNNVLDSTKAFTLRLEHRAEVEGLPASLLAFAAQQARDKGDADASADRGPWVFTLDFPSYFPFMQYAQRRDLREKMYRASLSRASDVTWYVEGDGVNNLPVCERILELRHERAQLLGYEHFAALSMASKMATYETASAQMEQLRAACFDIARAEHDELTAFARERGFPADEPLQQWDVTFWAERLKAERFGFEEEALRPYFSLPRVLDGLFALVKRLFEVDTVEVDVASRNIPVWDSSVRFFELRDCGSGEPVACFYLDAYSRPAEKRGGAWMDEVVSRSTLFAPSGARVRLPVAHMVTNQSPPVDGQPSLMTFREVETLFHELGHALQHMLTREDNGLVAGIRGVEWDAVELPSQFMENWFYDRATLLGLARHFETDEPLPDELYDKIVAAKKFRAATMLLRQLHFSIVDLELHSHYSVAKNASASDRAEKCEVNAENILAFERRVGERTLVLAPQDYDRFLCSFGHIFAGGYAAGYYSYKWAEILSADAFAAFEEAGLENDAAVRAVGRKFRDTVLALGGGAAPLEVFKLFRGREPTPDALLRQNDLTPATMAASAVP